jgi:hypothetical protein
VKTVFRWCLVCLASTCLWPAISLSDQEHALTDRIASARARLTSIQHRSERVRDINDIETLQREYGYYTDKMLWEQVLDLFSADATLEIGLSGVYSGKDSIRRYLYSLSGGKQGPIEGVLYEHMQFQPVITLSEDGQSAKGRWQALIQTGIYGSGSGGQWGEGPYENEYVREDGVWKIRKIHWYATFFAPYEGGWLHPDEEALKAYSTGRDVTPDIPATGEYPPYPAASIPPFHFSNPVTGEPWHPAP